MNDPAGRVTGVFLPAGRVLSLVGGLAILATYYMPWFGLSSTQGSILLSGDFLNRFLASGTDLSRFLPGASAGQAAALRALVLLFPTCGALAAVLALVGSARPGSRPLDVLLGLAGVIPLVGLLGGLSHLPPNASVEVGLWLIGAGAVAVLAGLALHLALH